MVHLGRKLAVGSDNDAVMLWYLKFTVHTMGNWYVTSCTGVISNDGHCDLINELLIFNKDRIG
jgi:hypothetical protein